MTVTSERREVRVGTELPVLRVSVGRAELVRYAGASGDFNPIHWDERAATAAGLPGVVAHGMLTMAYAARLITDWAGDASAMVDFAVRFTRPVAVDQDVPAELLLTGTVTGVEDDGLVRIGLTTTMAGKPVLSKAEALVRLPASARVG